jgi:uncharacterized RDD family membrane protein YckC
VPALILANVFGLGWAGWSLINGAGGVLYNTVLDGAEHGQTIGKRALGIQTRDDATGGAIGLSRAGVRSMVPLLLGFVNYVSPLLGIVVILDDLWPLWDAKKQTWHDKAAGSVVLKV